MNFRRLVTWLTFLAVFTMAVRVSIEGDTFWHLRAGSYLVENRQLITTDPFSLTRYGEPWIYPGWLAQILLVGVYQSFGYPGLNLFTALFVLAAFIALWPLLEGPVLWKSAVTILASAAAGVYWAARPHILSFTLAAVFLLVLETDRRSSDGKRALWLLPPLMALWTNLHGGFAIGFILIGLYGLASLIAYLDSRFRVSSGRKESYQLRKRMLILLAVGIGGALAVMLNPHGPRMLIYPFQTISIGTLQDFIAEWQSPNFHALQNQPFLWMLLLAMVSFAFTHQRVRVVEMLQILTFTYMGLSAGRNIALFSLVAAPIISRHGYSSLEPLIRDRPPGKQFPKTFARILNWTLFILLLVASTFKLSIPLQQEVNLKAIADQQPVGAVGYIKDNHPPGPLFNSYNYGGYVLWQLYPEYRSFVDGRTDLFNDEILEEYLSIWLAEFGWENKLAKWGIELILVESNSPLAIALRDSEWTLLFEGENAVLHSKGRH